MSQHDKRVGAKRETESLLKLYEAAGNESDLVQVAAKADEIRRGYGDWSIRTHFEELGLLEIAISKTSQQPNLAAQHPCFAIDNLNDEDAVRFAFDTRLNRIFQDLLVPRRRMPHRNHARISLPAAS